MPSPRKKRKDLRRPPSPEAVSGVWRVCTGKTGHLEAVEILYNPDRISYEELLATFWEDIDPTDPEGQFVDRGSQYRTAIFYHTEEQRRSAERSKEALEQSRRFLKPIATKILPAFAFYQAEESHHCYSQKCPLRYDLYYRFSGREEFKRAHWGGKSVAKSYQNFTSPSSRNSGRPSLP